MRGMSDHIPPLSKAATDLPIGTYKHYKGNTYRTLDVGRHSETLEEVVIYQALYGDHDIWVRPLSLFLETVEWEGKTVPRFTFLAEEA